MKGTLKPVFQRGKRVGAIREYSDTLLMFLLKAYRPEKFRDNWKGDLRVKPAPKQPPPELANLDDADLEILRKLSIKAAQPRADQSGKTA